MKLHRTLFIIAIIVCIPYMTMAFTWGNIFKWEQPEPPDQEKQVEMKRSSITAQQKLQNWEKTFKTKDFTLLKSNSDNFFITEKEANLLITEEINKTKNPDLKNARIYFLEDEIELKGDLVNPWKGEFILRVKPKIKNNSIEIDVTKARFRNFFFPKSFAKNLINKSIDDSLDLLFQYPDFEKLDVLIKNNSLELQYN